MVGTKLAQLKVEISKYLGIPYFTNKPYKFSEEAVLVGKGSAKEIAIKTVEIANEKNIKLLNFSEQEIYNFQKKNKIGIDCSGLACHLLNYLFDLNLNVRKTSADMLTSSPLSSPISFNEAQTGDLIRFNSGRHVIFIIEKINNTVFYVHNSELTKIRHVHMGTVDILNNSLTNWSDETKTGKDYSEIFNPPKGDGIFRINIKGL